MKTLLFYHYLYPDDVVSSVLFSELCQGLSERGWDVTGCCCTRSYRDPSASFAQATSWNGVEIRRIWRPKFVQSNSLGRALNSMWMIAAWSLLAFNPFLRPSQLVIGTDPVLSILVALPWKIIRPRVRIAHWCFDLYPEAAFADQLIPEDGLIGRIMIWLLAAAYRQCDLLADLGPCMRDRLKKYKGAQDAAITIPVWAIREPLAPASIDQSERYSLFGESQLAFLYSGSFGKAHCYEQVFDLAANFSPGEADFVFSARGNRLTELIQAVKSAPLNIKMADFVKSEALEGRLSAADIHIVTLRSEWTGTVIPSKFFGSLAIGRPVLFIGSASSAIAKWIKEFHVGWVIDTGHFPEEIYQMQIVRIVKEFRELAVDAEKLQMLFNHCHSVYQENFSKQRTLNCWHRELAALASKESGILENLPS